jgi:hypothetical protein
MNKNFIEELKNIRSVLYNLYKKFNFRHYNSKYSLIFTLRDIENIWLLFSKQNNKNWIDYKSLSQNKIIQLYELMTREFKFEEQMKFIETLSDSQKSDIQKIKTILNKLRNVDLSDELIYEIWGYYSEGLSASWLRVNISDECEILDAYKNYMEENTFGLGR